MRVRACSDASNCFQPPGSSVCAILHAIILEWVAMPSSRESSLPRDQTLGCWIDRQITEKNESCSVISDSRWPHGLYSSWNSPGQNTGVGSCSLLQRIFPTQGSNPGLLHCRRLLYQLSHQGNPRILQPIHKTGSSLSQLRHKGSACNAGDLGLIPGSERSPGEGNGNPLQYSCLENPMDRGVWWATVHGVAETRTRLSD